ncbi:MAG: MASE3 domain-containing protein [bacterium]
MGKRSVIADKYRGTILVVILAMSGLSVISRYNDPLFHSLAEIFSIIVASGIFIVAWNSRQYHDSNYFLFLGVAYLFIACLDLVHTLAYPGIGIFEGYDLNLSIQLRIASRYVESISLLIAPLIAKRKLIINHVLLVYATIVSLLLGSIFYWHTFPTCFINRGEGELTLFNTVSKAVICLIFLSSIGCLVQKRHEFDPGVLNLLIASIVVSLGAELAFTTSAHTDDLLSLVGHSLQTTSFYLIYKAIIETGLMQPYNLLFRNLKQREEALRESDKKYCQLLENAQEGIWTIDPEGMTTFVNIRITEILGYPADEILGKTISSFMDNRHGEVTKDYFEAYRQSPRERHQFEFLHKNGSLVYTILETSPLINDDGKYNGAMVFLEDVTDRKRAEEEKAKIQAQFVQSQKLEAIGLLAGGISHDFNNILATIQGYVTLAVMKTDKAHPLCRDLNQIRLAADRAANLTRQLLLFSHRKPRELALISLNSTIENLLKMLHRLIGENITVDTDLDAELWPLLIDEGNIEQVIMNIVINARDAMPNGGRITIKTQNVTLDETHSRFISQARAGQFTCLSITDTGIGMNKEIIDRIFEPFFTTKEVGKGTGLGLSVVYGIVKQHQGWINVYSEPGHGTMFKVYLPASPLPFQTGSESKTTKMCPLELLPGKGERILVVEDNETVRELTITILRENGYTVIGAASAREALNNFEQEQGEFDVILSDFILPDLTGLELADQFLLRQPRMDIILVSGYSDHKLQGDVLKERGFRFLQKPYNLDDLFRILREIIEHRSAVYETK